MASTEAFTKAYGQLNPKQKEAVDTLYGPVIVIAGPGTGKTQMLALRIGNILLQSTGTKPDEILALTFTESAVATLRARLASFIGPAAYRVRIHTFHSFAKSILELRPDLFPRIAEGTHLSEVRGVALIERLLDAGAYQKIRSPKNPHRTARELFNFLAKLKQEHYTPSHYHTLLSSSLETLLKNPDRIHEKGAYKGKEKGEYLLRRERLEKHLEVADLFAAYEDTLQKEALYDYEDLITEAIRGMEEDESFRALVGERSQFVLADEHQDANPAQNRLLELVTDFDGAPNLFIVGDEKQAIYRFQGASLASFFYFVKTYPEAKVISLESNYRSKSAILAAAHSLIESAPVPDSAYRPVLVPYRGEGGTLVEVVCDTPQDEYETIKAHIETLRAEGVAYEDIAIVTKKNADVLALSSYLRRMSIPEDHTSAQISALTHPVVVLFLALVRALTNLNGNADLAQALFLPGLPMELSERMRLLSVSREGAPLIEILEKNGDASMRYWVTQLKKSAADMPATPAVEWLARLASESGFVKGVLTLTESEDAYEAYQGLMDEAALLTREYPSATALDLLARIALIEKHALRVSRARTKHAGVRVMTVHSAKGLEFPHVIIAHASDEVWTGGKTDEFSLLLEKEEDEHDIRRLLYVALTRAKDTVLITRSNATAEGRAQTALRFLGDFTEHVEQGTPALQKPKETELLPRSILSTEFLRERLISQGFSPTGFNNYVQSPWQYYFRTLLRLPDAPTLPMLFGTAMHAGLEGYANARKQGKATEEAAFTSFNAKLAQLPLSPLDRMELSKKGTEALGIYIAQEHASFGSAIDTELPITISLSVPGIGDIPLSGKIDRLDQNDDGTVTVVDYKTGKAKSENEIKGNTKNSDGGYYRQLVFYKLLLTQDGRYTMRDAALHFVEPDAKGTCVLRTYAISDADVIALQGELIEAAQAIADGSAFRNPCDPEHCDFCPLVGFLLQSAEASA